MLSNLGKWFRHLVVGMIQGCLVLAVAAAVISFAGVLIVTHQIPSGVTLVLLGAIVGLCGVLGAAFALIWRLSHIEEAMHIVQDVTEEVAHRTGL